MKIHNEDMTTKRKVDNASEKQEQSCNYDNDYYGDQLCLDTHIIGAVEQSQFALANLLSF